MNFNEDSLKELKRSYESSVWHLMKCKICSKGYKKYLKKQFNLILDLIEDVEELKAQSHANVNGGKE